MLDLRSGIERGAHHQGGALQLPQPKANVQRAKPNLPVPNSSKSITQLPEIDERSTPPFDGQASTWSLFHVRPTGDRSIPAETA